MEGKLVAFIVLTITVGEVSPVFGQLNIANNVLSCRPKFSNDPLYSPLHTVIKSLYKSIGSIMPEGSLSILSKNECVTFSLVQKMIDGLSTGFEILEEKNCARVPEIEIAKETTVSATEALVETSRLAVQLIGQKPESFAKNINDFGGITKSFRTFFNAMKIVIDEICRGNQLIKINNNAHELLDEAHKKTALQADVFFYNLFNLIEKLNKSSSVLKLFGGQSDKSEIIRDERDKARAALATLFENGFGLLKKFIPKITKKV